MHQITSPRNPRVKAAVRLRKGRRRARQRRTLIDGCGAVLFYEALRQRSAWEQK